VNKMAKRTAHNKHVSLDDVMNLYLSCYSHVTSTFHHMTLSIDSILIVIPDVICLFIPHLKSYWCEVHPHKSEGNPKEGGKVSNNV